MITVHDPIEQIVFRILISQVYDKVTDQFDLLVIEVFTFMDMFHFVIKAFN